MAWGEKAKHQDQVLAKIREEGCIQRAILLQAFHHCLTGDGLKEIVHTLIDEDRVGYNPIQLKTGRMKVMYCTEDWVREQCKKEGVDKAKGKYSQCYQQHPEWFEEEKKGGKK